MTGTSGVENANITSVALISGRVARADMLSGDLKKRAAAYSFYLKANGLEDTSTNFQKFRREINNDFSAPSIEAYLRKNNVSGEFVNSTIVNNMMSKQELVQAGVENRVNSTKEYYTTKIKDQNSILGKAGLSDEDFWLSSEELTEKLTTRKENQITDPNEVQAIVRSHELIKSGIMPGEDARDIDDYLKRHRRQVDIQRRESFTTLFDDHIRTDTGSVRGIKGFLQAIASDFSPDADVTAGDMLKSVFGIRDTSKLAEFMDLINNQRAGGRKLEDMSDEQLAGMGISKDRIEAFRTMKKQARSYFFGQPFLMSKDISIKVGDEEKSVKLGELRDKAFDAYVQLSSPDASKLKPKDREQAHKTLTAYTRTLAEEGVLSETEAERLEYQLKNNLGFDVKEIESGVDAGIAAQKFAEKHGLKDFKTDYGDGRDQSFDGLIYEAHMQKKNNGEVDEATRKQLDRASVQLATSILRKSTGNETAELDEKDEKHKDILERARAQVEELTKVSSGNKELDVLTDILKALETLVQKVLNGK
jgi:hypothetical protein